MPTYFKPLRRKIGVLALTMACVFAAGWVRSFFAIDEFVTEQYRVANAIVSTPDGIRFEIRYYFDGYFPQNGYSTQTLFTIPYVSLVGSLILLSAWLLLSKPRTKTEKPIMPVVEKS